MRCYGYGSQDDCTAGFLGLFIAAILVGFYWLCCRKFFFDIKGILITIHLPDNVWLLALVLAYWVVIVAIIEEWFWRNYMWGFLYNDRFLEKLFIALVWGTMYAAVLLNNRGWLAAIVLEIILTIVGYILAPVIRWKWSFSATAYIRMGMNLGLF